MFIADGSLVARLANSFTLQPTPPEISRPVMKYANIAFISRTSERRANEKSTKGADLHWGEAKNLRRCNWRTLRRWGKMGPRSRATDLGEHCAKEAGADSLLLAENRGLLPYALSVA